MADSRPLLPVRRGPSSPGHVPPALAKVSHVFLCVDAVRRPLTPPYVGPFPVLDRGPKTFRILKSGKETIVSIDRLKPAFTSAQQELSLPSAGRVSPPVLPVPVPPVVPVSGVAVDQDSVPVSFTSSGR